MKLDEVKTLHQRIRAINLEPSAMRWLPMPPDVDDMSQISEIDVCRTGLDELPIPLKNQADWIGCFQAAPHSDPDWKDCVFVTLAVRADHTFETMVSPGQVVSVPVEPGTLFVFDPVMLHWLKPNSALQETGFAAIQWSINRKDFPRDYRIIRKGLRALGTARSQLVEVINNRISWQRFNPSAAAISVMRFDSSIRNQVQFPAAVLRLEQGLSASSVATDGISDLAAPFSSASEWVLFNESWPDRGPDEIDTLDIHLAIYADHSLEVVDDLAKSKTTVGIFSGTLFVWDRRSFSWVSQHSPTGMTYVGLRWVVKRHDLDSEWTRISNDLLTLVPGVQINVTPSCL
jgi:hypothetical protein